jgi:hypothetical protein
VLEQESRYQARQDEPALVVRSSQSHACESERRSIRLNCALNVSLLVQLLETPGDLVSISLRTEPVPLFPAGSVR